jgi:para-aminobenzoate synthetase
MVKTLLIDNYDSFTFNLYQALAQVNGSEPVVVRNDAITLEGVRGLAPDNIVLSPGPGRPEHARDFGVCRDVLLHMDVPILGVCLGSQGLGAVYGARVDHAPAPMHGRSSAIWHDDAELFAGIPQGFLAVRYHSLAVVGELPACLRRIAWTADGVLMGLRHVERPLWGVQFHPESIQTEYGVALLENFRAITERRGGGRRAPVVASPEPASRPVPPPSAWDVIWARAPSAPSAEAVYLAHVARRARSVWLDSSLVAPGLSRFSIMGAADGPSSYEVRYRVGEDVVTTGNAPTGAADGEALFAHLQRVVRERGCSAPELPFDFHGGFVGYLGYGMKGDCGAMPGPRAAQPDAVFLFLDRFLVFDHEQQDTYVVAVCPTGERAVAEAWVAGMVRTLEDPLPAPAEAEAAPECPGGRFARGAADYRGDIAACRAQILEGESYEICLTNMVHVPGRADAVSTYRRLRRLNPAPYAALFRVPGLDVLSSSPERFLRVDREGGVESKPIKGTARRGATPAEDEGLRDALRGSEKNRAENLMIVDLMRHDLGGVCAIGSVSVPVLMGIESYATVHQMVSTVRGRLRPDVDAVTGVQHAFPAGSMTGAPKLRTMEILDRLETEARGIYSGALGYFSLNGAADLSVVIRTMVMADGETTIGTGGAVVALSDPEEEWAEMRLKTRALMQALGARMK